jgi:hypothetical protein
LRLAKPSRRSVVHFTDAHLAEAFAADHEHLLAWYGVEWLVARLDGTPCWSEQGRANDTRAIEAARIWALRRFQASEGSSSEADWAKALAARRLMAITRLARGILRMDFEIVRCTEHNHNIWFGRDIVEQHSCYQKKSV